MEETLFSAHHSLENRHWWFRGRRHAIRELGMLLAGEGGTIVDVGCGTGADIAAFPDSYRRHGIDISPTAIEFARKTHKGVLFETGAVPEVGADAIGAADLVLLCDVLEHIEDDQRFLLDLVSLMKPGGHLLLTVPADPRLWSPHDEVYGHFRRYTRTTLTAVCIRTPAILRLLAPFNRRLYPVARAARALSKLRGRGWGRDSSDLTLPWSPVNTVLERVFAGEVGALSRALKAGQDDVVGRGVSPLAVLQRVHTKDSRGSHA